MLTAVEVVAAVVAVIGYGLTQLGDAMPVHVVGGVLLGLGAFVALVAGLCDFALRLARD